MKVAAFNVQKFGNTKLSDPAVLKTLIKIVSRYDIIVILEVVDSSGVAVKTFLEKLNKSNQDDYKMKISKRLGTGTETGTGTYKEQYMFLYRKSMVDSINSHQYKKPGGEDVFARPPFVLRFTCSKTVLENLVLIPIHTKPKTTLNELHELHDVFQDVKKKWKTDNIMILGDFNADGSSASEKKDLQKIDIRSGTDFHWLITDDMDTTVIKSNDNTYDRIVVYGDNMKKAVVPNSAKPFNFQTAYKLTDEDALKVSDHYPVEVKLKNKPKTRTAAKRLKTT